MSAVEFLEQSNMFTGQWEIKRTRNTLHQVPMFSVNETFEFGARVRPYLSEVPAPTLELISEDVKTPEQIERDLMREAEGLTSPMFSGEALPESEDEPERGEVGNENDQEQTEKPVHGEVTKFSAYRALVSLVREQAMTLWVDGTYRQRYYNQLPVSIQAAQGAGLTPSEISAAMQIGEFLGNRERQAASLVADAAESVSAPLSPQTTTRSVRAHEGLRMRLRREGVSVRTRQPKPETPKIVPVEWMEREHIQKRLPYLSERISRLDGEELASLAEGISEVLQETFWTIMGITLAHYLDHEQQGEQGERRERTA